VTGSAYAKNVLHNHEMPAGLADAGYQCWADSIPTE